MQNRGEPLSVEGQRTKWAQVQVRVAVLWVYLLSFSFSAFSLLASCAFSAIHRETSSWLSSVVFLSFSSREEKAICRASYSSFSVWFALSRSCRRQRRRNLKVDFALAHLMFLYPVPRKRPPIENLRSAPFSSSSLAWHSMMLDSVRCLSSHSLQDLHTDSVMSHPVWLSGVSTSTGAQLKHYGGRICWEPEGSQRGLWVIRPFTNHHWPWQ